jgi:hypothetical protein
LPGTGWPYIVLLYCVVYACKTCLRVRNGDVASRQGVLGGSWTQLGSDWLACRYGGCTGDGGAHGQQGQRHLGWRRGRGHGHDGGKVLAAIWPRVWLSMAGLA